MKKYASYDFSFLERMGHCIEDSYRSTKFWGAKMGDMLQGFCDFSGIDENRQFCR
jgi:hypothetical protein